jgi:hypothetical protein
MRGYRFLGNAGNYNSTKGQNQGDFNLQETNTLREHFESYDAGHSAVEREETTLRSVLY